MILKLQWRSRKKILLRVSEQRKLALSWENEDIEMISKREILGRVKGEN
jgi:hypothetical protein